MNIARRVAKNTFFLLGGTGLGAVFTLLAMIYLARVLGPNGFGQISFAMAIAAYFISLNNLGLPLFGTRQVAREKEKISYYAGDIITARLFLTILGFGILFCLIAFLSKPLTTKYLITLYGLGMISASLLLDWAFQGVEKMGFVGFGRILSAFVYFL